jgi:DNA modification methylase
MFSLHHGDCLDVLKTFEDNSVDSIVTDPPYGILMMGRKWDASVPSVAIWAECLRVLKPGGHLLAFAGTRTQHRMAVNIEDAGFEIRDMMGWVYGSGFPKSHNISKNLDKAAGAEREVVGEYSAAKQKGSANWNGEDRRGGKGSGFKEVASITAPATPAAEQWDGWGSALKPAIEPITVARKPFNGTLADNVLRWGTGGINVDACRVGIESRWNPSAGNKNLENRHTVTPVSSHKEFDGRECNGRWPANLIHDGSDEVVALFPQAGGGFGKRGGRAGATVGDYGMAATMETVGYGDTGSAARFFYAAPPDSDELPIDSADPIFYCAKASKRDRDEGCEELDIKEKNTRNSYGDQSEYDCPDGANRVGDKGTSLARNHHPTVKPTSLMRYLCRLVTPPNGVILDPFCGSGSTGKGAIREGFRFIGIDLSEEYLDIARRRITLAMSQVEIDAETADPHWAATPSAEPQPQQIEIAGIIPPAPKQGRLF